MVESASLEILLKDKILYLNCYTKQNNKFILKHYYGTYQMIK